MLYIAPNDWKAIDEKNREGWRKRSEFGRRHFDGISWYDVKTGLPYSPSSLKPQTPEQELHVREYTFLWMNTFPRELPTHRYRTLSFQRFDQRYLMFAVKSDGQDYRRISEADRNDRHAVRAIAEAR